MVATLILIFALLVFVLAAFGVQVGHVVMIPIGLALVVVAIIVDAVPRLRGT